MILYEHPFNERVRTYLRLEHLFQRFDALVQRDQAIDNHFALITLFELIDAGSRSDLKSDLLKDMDRHKQQFTALRGNPSVSEQALEQFLERLEYCHSNLSQTMGKIGQSVSESELLSGLRNRITIRVAHAVSTCPTTTLGNIAPPMSVAPTFNAGPILLVRCAKPWSCS